MTGAVPLPSWVRWRQRPFPDCNLFLVLGRVPALIDSGFVGHAKANAEWVHSQSRDLAWVVNTHWHSDHVGGNAILQAAGARVAASTLDAHAVGRRSPSCCLSEYLDQPVPPYTVDEALEDGQVLRLGDVDWQVIHTPGHTPGHLAFWQPEERLLVVGDALSTYDVGWINLALDGPDAAATALRSLQRLADLSARIVLPGHGPLPEDPGAMFAAALRRAQRLVDDPKGAVWYGARRIFGYALMIYDGIPAREAEPYLHARTWVADAARLLGMTPQVFAAELLGTMLRGGAIVVRDHRMYAAADYSPVKAETLRVPFPREWPSGEQPHVHDGPFKRER